MCYTLVYLGNLTARWLALVCAGFLLASPGWASERPCAGSIAVTSFRLTARADGKSAWKPVRRLNAIGAGYTLRYEPIRVPADKDAAIALVIVPHPRPANEEGSLSVLPVRKANKSSEWVMPASASVLSLVYGPNGLDHGKVKNLVKNDRELIGQLANYAEQTALVEALVEELSGARQNGGGLESALAGLSASGVGNFQQLNRAAPADQQAAVLLRALNPALSSLDPLAPSPDARTAQTVGLATSVAGLFFGNTVGLAAGSALMFQNLRTILWPGTEFRSSFAQLGSSNELALCAQGQKIPPRMRPAYLWAMRVPNASPPALEFDGITHLPAGARMLVPVKFAGKPDWPGVSALDDWRLVAADRRKTWPVTVLPQADRGSLAVEVPDIADQEHPYRLVAAWDWQELQVGGEVRVAKPSALRTVEIPSESRDRLIAGSKDVEMTLLGSDLQFLDKVELAGNGLSTPRSLQFRLPRGRGAGVQDRAQVRAALEGLSEGNYHLCVTQLDGSTLEVPLRLLPPHPVLELPIKANVGETAQVLALEGSRLERIERIETPVLSTSALGTVQAGKRSWSVVLDANATVGQRVPLRLKVEGVSQPIEVQNAFEILGPRARIVSARVSLPSRLGISLHENELPADWNLTVMLHAQHAAQPVVSIGCKEKDKTLASQTLRPGERSSAASLDSMGEGSLFLSVTPGLVGQPDCHLDVRIETANGVSAAHELGRVLRLPRIERFEVTNEAIGESLYAAYLEGYHLETIERTGWGTSGGYPVEALPTALEGRDRKQALRIGVRWPSPRPKAPLYIWLRGEANGRATQVTY